MHYFQKNIGDYYKKAGRLSMLEHGAYGLLNDACYDRERFPTRDEAIDWTWASNTEEIEAVDFVLKKFFKLQDDGTYKQKRIAEEIDAFKVKGLINKCIALSREAKKVDKPKLSHDYLKLKDEIKSDIKDGTCIKSHETYTNLINSITNEHAPSPNHKPLTNNHKPLTNKPITINQEPTTNGEDDVTPDFVLEQTEMLEDTFDAEKAFDEFWSLYPRKDNKKRSKVIFLREINNVLIFADVMEGLKNQIDFKFDDPQYIPMPTTWLNGENWNDTIMRGGGDQALDDFINDGVDNSPPPEYDGPDYE